MRLVVDANILLAGIIRNAATRKLLLDKRLDLTAPESLSTETFEHVKNDEKILKKTGLTIVELETIFLHLSSQISFKPEQAYASQLGQALTLAVHQEDAPYLALGLTENCAVWSNDADLKRQNQVTVLTTKELLEKISTRPA